MLSAVVERVVRPAEPEDGPREDLRPRAAGGHAEVVEPGARVVEGRLGPSAAAAVLAGEEPMFFLTF